MYYTGIPLFLVLCRYRIFLQIEGLWRPCIEKTYWRHFFNSLCSLCVSVSHFGNSSNISNFFIIIASVTATLIFDVTIVIVLGRHKPRTYKTANLIDKYCVRVLTAPPAGHSPFSAPILGPLYSLTCNDIGQLITLQWPRERKSK
jgi:hypothetical protein